MKGMNLSSFKKVAEDNHSATMMHKDGHKMVIAKGPLPAIQRKQLEKLPLHKADGAEIKFKKYADGTGDVEADDAAPTPVQTDAAPPDLSGPPEPDQPQIADPNAAATTPDQSAVDRSPASGPKAQASGLGANGYAREQAANLEQARAEGAQGNADSGVLNHVNARLDALPTQNDIVNKYRAKNDQLMNAYQSKQLDPDHYWQSHSKISAGIGMMLGGIGGGVSGHGGNVGLDIVNQGINRDIDAQKNSQDQSMNLWKMNRQALGDDLSANLATQNQMLTGVKYKLMKTAADSMGPLAIAKAHQMNAQIQQKMDMNTALMGLNAGLKGKAGDGSESTFQNNLNMASRYSPEMYKDAQDKYIPGVGVTKIPVTKENRDTFTALDNLDKQLDRGINFAKTTGTTVPGTVANQEANDIQNSIQLEIGNLVGLKRINEFEGKKYTDMAGSPGALRSGAAVQSMNDLKKLIDTKKTAEASNLGLTPFRKASPDMVAMQWAQANPRDPRAAKIMNMNGRK